MHAILTAIGKGFTSNRILNQLGNKFPNLANTLFHAQAIGYTSSQILKGLYKNSTGKDLPEESFMTENERRNKRESKEKRDRALTTIGALGTAGALAAGGYALATRNAAINPTAILPAIQRNQQRQLPGNNPPMIGQIGPGPRNQGPGPSAPAASPQKTNPKQPIQTVSSKLLKDIVSRDPLKSFELVKNLKQENKFNLISSQGYDPETSTQLLKMVLPREVVKELENAPGGLEGITKDYMKVISQNKNNQEVHQQSMNENPLEQVQRQQAPEMEEQQQQQPIFESPQSEISPSPKISNIAQSTQEPEIETQGNLALLPKGQIGELESVKNGIAKININGKLIDKKASEIEQEPLGTEQAVRHIINSIPENLKSTALQSMVYIPGTDIMLIQFYDGKWAWYKDFPEETYRNIALGTYQPKGQERTGIGEYSPSVADSRGAGFHSEVKINPKYSKENKGITWGYASNEYALLHSIQNAIHKISKEKLDEKGNVIPKKTRTKKPS